MRRLITVLAALLGLVSADVGAQVYIWRDPGSKTVHLDSSAPSWYTQGDGPRTQLFIDGALTDDTRWKERNVIRFRVYERWNAGSSSGERQVAFGSAGRYQARASKCRMEIPREPTSIGELAGWRVVMAAERQKFEACQMNEMAERGQVESLAAIHARDAGIRDVENATTRALRASEARMQAETFMAAQAGTRRAIQQCQMGLC